MHYSKPYDPAIFEAILSHGREILNSPGMKLEKSLIQHSDVSCFQHCTAVAYVSAAIDKKWRLSSDISSLIRGALLHDYFLYDWHEPHHGLHGFRHAAVALKNAERDFFLNAIEKDIISRHMFPLNIIPPAFKESRIVCLADKICAGYEVASRFLPLKSAAMTAAKTLG